LKDDYQAIQSAATTKKQQDAIDTWTKKRIATNFIRIADDFKNCSFNNKWIN